MDDVLTVAYRFSQPGYAITIRIFDLSGQLIQTVANNALAETEGLAVWNATQDNGGLARTGPYVVWMQAIHPGGDQILQRASAAVSH
jgi:flagellar hook assembly protein FlgD